MKYVKTLFLDFTKIVLKASPNGAADHSQGIYPLVNGSYQNSSPNGATETDSRIYAVFVRHRNGD